MNIVQLIAAESADCPGKTAIIDGDRAITYGDLLAEIAKLSQLLQQQGIASGQRIAFHCGDGIDYVIGSLALLNCGAAVVPVADKITDEEVREIIDRVEVHGLLIHRDIARAASEQNGQKIDGIFNFQPRQAASDSDERCKEIGAAFIRFSSGTTGQSKGVLLSHQSIVDRTDAANRGLGITRDDVILWVLGMSYHFVVSILLFLRKGATIVVANQFFPFSLLEAARRHPVTFIYASPVHYHLLGLSDAVEPEALANVRLAISTSMKMPAEISQVFSVKFGIVPAEAYGIIEIGLPFINTEAWKTRSSTVGRVLPDYQLQIRDADDEGVGQVFIRGKGMFDAYFSPWRSRADCTENGWFHTGDLGRVDPERQLELVGRSKTVLICAGMKVFPEEVEQVINTFPGVLESMVLGQDHPQLGQVPAAQVVLADGADAGSIIDQLRGHCCQKLSAYKVPVKFVNVARLPKTGSGKIARSGSTMS